MSTITEVDKGDVLFLSVWRDRFTQRVEQGTEYAIPRVYENKEGIDVSIWEIRHKFATGRLTKMFVRTQEGGHQQLLLYIQKEHDLAIVFIPVKSRYFTSFVKRLPNVDFKTDIKIYPYDFKPAGGKRLMGLGIMQDGSKLNDFYWDNENKCRTGLPEQKKDYGDMTDEEKAEMFSIQTQYFIESIEILNSQIPKDDLYAKSEKISTKHVPKHAGDEFLALTKEEPKPKL